MIARRCAPARIAAAAALLVLWGCVGARHGLSRDALEASLRATVTAPALPAHSELVALRYPSPAGGGDDAELSPCLVAAARRSYQELVGACAAVVEQDPAAPRALAAARTLLRAEAGYSPAGAVVAERGPAWLDACRKRRGACADLAQLVAAERAERAAVAKDVEAFAAAVTASGRLRTAQVDGPWPGDARRVLERDAAGVESPRHATAFRTVEQTSPDGFFSPAASGTSGVYRLRFTVAAQGRVTALITGPQALRARIDGAVVAERLPEDDAGAVTRVGLELSAGPHAVELLALSLGSNDRISVALVDELGQPAASSAPFGSVKLRDNGVKVVAARGAVEALAVAPDSAGLEELLWRVAVVRPPTLGPRQDEALLLGRALVTRFGRSPVALATAAEILGEEAGVPSRVSSSSAATLWARVLEVWPDHPVARISAARNAREQRPDEALAAYRKLVADKPRYAFGLREAVGQLLDVGALDEARRVAELLLALEPSAENLDTALPALRALGEHARAAELERSRASLDASFSPMRQARLELDGLHTAEGLSLLQQGAKREPWGPATREAIGLLALADAPEALRVAETAAALRPGDPELAVRLVELVRVVRGEAIAKDALLAALPRLRGSELAARTAERYGVIPPWSARDTLAAEALQRRRAAPALFGEHAAVALLDDVERWYFEDDSSLVMRHFMIELAGKEVLDRFGELSVGGARVVRARVYKPDGSYAEAEHPAGIEDLSLPELAVGDVVELLTAERDGASPFAGTFETRALDGMPTPALQRRYLVSFPAGFEEAHHLEVIAAHGLPAPARERFVDSEGHARVRLTFALTDVAAEPAEPFAPDPGETARAGGFAWGLDDEVWAVLRGTTIERAARADSWLEGAARLIAGSGEPTDRLARIFAFVVRKIEPASSPDDAVSALLLGQGERTALLLALARAAGLDAAPVALQLVTQLTPEVPDGNAWRVTAVRVRIGEREHYAIVDGNAVLDRLPPAARGAWVLDLSRHASGPRRSRLPDSAIDAATLSLQGSLAVEDAAGAPVLTGVVVITLPAAAADLARRALRRATPEQAQALVEGALSPSFPGIAVADVRLPTIEAFGEALRIGSTVRVPLGARDDGAVRFEHLFAQGVAGLLGTAPAPAAYLAVPERKRPLVMLEDAEVLDLDIVLPKGALFVEAPGPKSARAGPLELEQRVEITDGRLSWHREIRRHNARVAVAEWPAVAAALAGIAGHLDARLGFVLGAPALEPK